MKTEYNKALFANYAALTITGYNLADAENIALQSLIHDIRQTVQLSKAARDYFSAARTNQYPVNPYFPVASELASACFFLAKDSTLSLDNNAYLAFLCECNNGIPTTEDHAKYLLHLPVMLADILQNHAFVSLFEKHNALVRNLDFSIEADQIIEQAVQQFPTFAPPVFAPCLLQSPMIADFARHNGILYVISASPKPQTMLHEWLHIVIAQHRDLLAQQMLGKDIQHLYDPAKLRSLGYLRGDHAQHYLHALEECIVQGLTAYLAQSESKAKAQISQLYEQGFYTAQTAWQQAQALNPNQNNLTSYLVSLFTI